MECKWDKKIVDIKNTYPQPCDCMACAFCDAHAPDYGDMKCEKMLQIYTAFVKEPIVQGE